MFTPIQVERVRDRFALLEQARRFGEGGLPAPDDVELDGPQKRVKQYVTESINDAFRRANLELERLRGALRSRDVSRKVSAVEQAPSRLNTKIARKIAGIDREIDRLEAQRASESARLSEFRRTYEVDRDPELLEPWHRRGLLYGVLALALLQAAANTFFFAQGSRWGLSAGLAFAFLLGFVDVAFHLSGGWVLRGLRSPTWWDRFFGSVMLALIFLSVPLWNLGIVHLRNGVRVRGFEAGLENWLPAFAAAPFGFEDFTSWVLLAIGLGCSISAVVAGAKWDEPIPALRKSGYKLRELQEDLSDLQSQRAEVEETQRNAMEDELDGLIEEIERDVVASEAIVARMKRLRENLFVFVDDAEKAYQTLIQIYRDENRLARPTDAPEAPPYFQERPSINTDHPLDLDMEELKKILEDRIDLARRVKEIRPLMNSEATHEPA